MEAQALARVSHAANPMTWRSSDGFVAALESIASEALARQVRVRTGRVGTVPDRHGLVLEFVPSEQLSGRLDLLRSWLLDEEIPQVARAAVACQYLACCHPFEDGNGRTARMVANALLIQGGMQTNRYMPLHELFVLSLGGMEVRSRMVELNGAWNAWIAWFCDLVELTATVPPDSR